MHVFVTGGAGFIGSHCCKAFAERGWRVTVYDDLSRGWRDFVKWGELIEGDVLDPDSVRRALAAARPDAVAHFAALIEVGESVVDPAAFFRTNVAGTLNVLDAMRAEGLDKLVFSSTAAVYGAPQYIPIDEEHPKSPSNPYGWSKLMVEQILADYDRAYGLRHAALRYFNAAGADPAGEVGERHDPETHVIPLAIRGALNGDFVFTIFGEDFDTRDGTCVRDFVHVVDLADAHCRAVQYLADGGASAAFNLGTGAGTTVKEIADTVEKATGADLGRRIGPRRPGDTPVLAASSAKAERILGWRPARSDVQTIVSDALAWHRSED